MPTLPPVTIITPISDRPYTEGIYHKWIQEMVQKYDGYVQLIIADDGQQPAFKLDPQYDNVLSVGMKVDHIYIRRESSLTPLFSFLGNLEAALDKVSHDIVFILEDDDYHTPNYLTQMVNWLLMFPKAEVLGESAAKYYNVVTRRFHVFPHSIHSSLCQTVLRGKGIDVFREIVRDATHFSVDSLLWKRDDIGRVVIPGSSLSVGIKGLSPLNGLGVGHHDTFGQVDSTAWVLKYWIGSPNAQVYLEAADKFKRDYGIDQETTGEPLIDKTPKK